MLLGRLPHKHMQQVCVRSQFPVRASLHVEEKDPSRRHHAHRKWDFSSSPAARAAGVGWHAGCQALGRAGRASATASQLHKVPSAIPSSRLAAAGPTSSVGAQATCLSSFVYLRGDVMDGVLILRSHLGVRPGFQRVSGWTESGKCACPRRGPHGAADRQDRGRHDGNPDEACRPVDPRGAQDRSGRRETKEESGLNDLRA